jgi:hypothetical protein
MMPGDAKDYGYVSPYLKTPIRSQEEAERDRQADAKSEPKGEAPAKKVERP